MIGDTTAGNMAWFSSACKQAAAAGNKLALMASRDLSVECSMLSNTLTPQFHVTKPHLLVLGQLRQWHCSSLYVLLQCCAVVLHTHNALTQNNAMHAQPLRDGKQLPQAPPQAACSTAHASYQTVEATAPEQTATQGREQTTPFCKSAQPHLLVLGQLW
jgi:hypothetical protein